MDRRSPRDPDARRSASMPSGRVSQRAERNPTSVQRPATQRASKARAQHRSSTTNRSTQRPTQRSAQTSTNQSQTRRSTASRHASNQNTGRAYNTPAVWTKDTPRSSASSENPLVRMLKAIGRFLWVVLGLLGSGLVALGRGIAALATRSRVALAIMVVSAVLVVGGLADFGLNYGKVYPGVHVGEIDAGGKTVDELTSQIDATYSARLATGSVIIYANDDAEARVGDQAAAAQDAALAEQVAVEEAQANKLAWTADANLLHASLPAQALAEEAIALGRENGGFFARMGALLFGTSIEPHAAYDEGSLEDLASDIDATIGNPRVDYNIAISDGRASVSDGHDGYMLDRNTFKQSLDQALLTNADDRGTFVAHADYAPLRIDQQAAQATADAVNRAIGDGVRFSYNDSTWDASATDIGAWISTRVQEDDKGFSLIAFVNESQAKPFLLSHVENIDTNNPVHVTFETQGADVTVHTDGSETIPLVSEAVQNLDVLLFGNDGKASGTSTTAPLGTPVEVAIAQGSAPTTLTFDEAEDLGIVGSISSYTTEFTTGAGTENRNHNIALVSELLSNSVVRPGETWSFNETAGECNEEKGFLGAGAIVDGEYDDAVGGGICQVATTVFNAVYESGFPVVTRHNHSLYISSYPAGRDAAVSWPDLDLVWENDSASDVLVRLSCADGSVTATLYGVNPGYQVSSVTGEWSEGEHYTTKTKVDESLAPGTNYVKTRGTDGRKITVVRTVKDEHGAVVREDSFSSVYDPVTEVVVKGPDAESSQTSA